MKILNVVYDAKINTGGKISHLLLMEELQKMGHTIKFLSTEHYQGFETFLMKDYKKMPFRIRQKLVKKEVLKILRKEKFDYLYSTGYYSMPGVIEAGLRSKIKVISHFRDYWFADVNGTFVGDNGKPYDKCNVINIFKYSKKSRILYNLYKWQYLKSLWPLLNKSDIKIAVSNAVKEVLLSIGVKDVKVLPNPIDIEVFKRANGNKIRKNYKIEGKIVISFIGSLAYHKGVLILMNLIPQLLKERKDICFLIVGDGPLKEQFANFVKSKNLKEVIFTGKVPYTEIPNFYAASDIVLFPSICKEAFGRIAIEAMAARKPVVASKVGGIKEIIEDGKNGFLVEPFNLNEWKSKIIELIKNEELRKKIGKNAEKDVRKYETKNIAKKFVKILKSA